MVRPGRGQGAEGRDALRRAYALRERLTERERYHIEALHAGSRRDQHHRQRVSKGSWRGRLQEILAEIRDSAAEWTGVPTGR